MAGFTHDFIIDLATSLPDTRDTEMEPSTLSWGLDLTFLDDTELDVDSVSPTPPSPPAASLNVVVLPRNSEVSVMCGCRGNFTWELIPTEYCHFYLFPHLVNTVDHTVGTCKPLSTFTEALWEGYNICIRHIMSTDKLTDYCLAVYQQHKSSCYRNLTRYTVKSVKNILLFIEKFKISGVSSAFCSCPPHTAKTDSPIFCFTCIQLHCEVKSMFLDNIDKNFSYQNQANSNFTLNAIQSPMDVNLFKAQSLFHPAISITRTLCPKKMIYFNRWDQVKLNTPKIRSFFGNPSLCLICKNPGNGKEVFLCQRCSRTAVV